MPALRLALPGDAPSLAILAERTFRDAFGARNSPENMDLHCAKCFGPDIQLREIGERGLVTTLADEAGQLVGFTQLRLVRPSPAVTARKPAELSRIYVTAEWQARGVARALMDQAFADAARGGCDRLWLGVWEHNPKAMAFYRKCGFEVVGTQAFMLGQERQRDLIMAVDVRPPG
jgi:ribosomal protein S18 acetylase RimI-like enzyme